MEDLPTYFSLANHPPTSFKLLGVFMEYICWCVAVAWKEKLFFIFTGLLLTETWEAEPLKTITQKGA